MSRPAAWLKLLLPPLCGALIFLCATLPNIELPGIQYDEVYYVPPAAALLKNNPAGVDDYVMLNPSVIDFFGKPLPLMFNYYTSFFRTYLTLPVFAAFGISVATIRGSSIALGAVALVFFIAFARRLTRDAAVAFACSALLALDASFIAYVRNDFAVVATMMALKGVALWALLRWWQEADAKFLYLGSFAIGLGITDRASFLWIPMAMLPAMLMVYGKELPNGIRQRLPSMKRLVAAVFWFSCGASIFLAFNAATLGGTFTPMLSTFGKTSGGADNFAFFENLYLRMQMLTEVLGGGYLNHFIAGEKTYQTPDWNFSGSPMSWLFPLAFVYFAIRLVAQHVRASRASTALSMPRKPLLFSMLMIVFLLIFSCFTPTLLRGHQLLMLYPFPHLLVALFALEAAKILRQSFKIVNLRFLSALAGVLILLISLAAVRPIFAYHQLIEKTGGRGAWSDAIYEIVAEIERYPERTVVCMDWGFNANILSLTKQPIRTIRNYYPDTRRTPEKLTTLFDAQHVFLFHSPEYTLMPAARDDFASAAGLSSARVDTLRRFYQREGQPIALLLRVQYDSE